MTHSFVMSYFSGEGVRVMLGLGRGKGTKALFVWLTNSGHLKLVCMYVCNSIVVQLNFQKLFAAVYIYARRYIYFLI